MKTITLVRHAKSSWENIGQSDFDRPLNERGLKDAPIMASKVSKLLKKPDIFFSSSAERAITTAHFFADAYNIEHTEINRDIEIYDKGQKRIVELINCLDKKFNSAIFFGHNPDISTLASFFSGEYFIQVPTCSILCFDFKCENWSEISFGLGKLRFFEYPKK